MFAQTSLFTAVLCFGPLWEMTDIRFDDEARQVGNDMGFPAGSRFAYPSCNAVDQPGP